jgi:uncharacterized membrane protein
VSTLVAATYPDQHRAEEVLATLRRLQSQQIVDLDDACIVTKNADGKLKLHQAVNLTGAGAAGGGTWGLLIGALFSIPLWFIPGAGLAALATTVGTAAVGAGAGAIAGHFSDYGISDDFIKQLGREMQPNSSVLFILARNAQPDRIIPEVAKFGGTILRTNLSNDAEEKLKASLTAAQQAAVGQTAAQPSSPPAAQADGPTA